MDIRQIRYFLAVADSGTFLRAASQLRVSQPGLSKAIRSLEESLQVRLFDRSGTGVSLTPYGKVLYKYGLSIVNEISSARQELDAARNTPNGFVNIGTLRASTSILAEVTIRFAQKHPDVRVRIGELQNPDLVAGLERGEFDFIIGIIDTRLSEHGFHYEFLFNDRLSIIGRPDHPIWRNKKITPAVMKRYSWVLPTVGLLHRRRLDEMFMTAGLEPLNSSIECGGLQYIRSMLMRSDYLALVPEHSVKFERELNLLRVLPLESEFMLRPIGLIYDSHRPLSEAAKALAADLCSVCREQTAS